MRITKTFPLFFLLFFIGCTTQVSDSVSQTNYVEIDGIDFNEEDKIETSLADRVYFNFDKSNLSDETKNILSQYVSESKKAVGRSCQVTKIESLFSGVSQLSLTVK